MAVAEKKQIKGKAGKVKIKGWVEKVINKNQVKQGLYQGTEKKISN